MMCLGFFVVLWLILTFKTCNIFFFYILSESVYLQQISIRNLWNTCSFFSACTSLNLYQKNRCLSTDTWNYISSLKLDLNVNPFVKYWYCYILNLNICKLLEVDFENKKQDYFKKNVPSLKVRILKTSIHIGAARILYMQRPSFWPQPQHIAMCGLALMLRLFSGVGVASPQSWPPPPTPPSRLPLRNS